MFRTSPQLLTTSSYDSIRRQNYEEIILLQSAPRFLHIWFLNTQPPNIICVVASRSLRYVRDQTRGQFMKCKYCPDNMEDSSNMLQNESLKSL